MKERASKQPILVVVLKGLLIIPIVILIYFLGLGVIKLARYISAYFG